MTNTAFFAALIENFPSASVDTAFLVFLIETVAPATGAPALLVTVPVTFSVS
jgi:hypothetical protein